MSVYNEKLASYMLNNLEKNQEKPYIPLENSPVN